MKARQRKALAHLAGRDAEESLAQIARRVGVRLETLCAWLAEAEFHQALVERVRSEIRSWLPIARDVLLRRALVDGDRECLKLMLNFGGLLATETPDARAASPRDELRALSDEELLERIARLREIAEHPSKPPGQGSDEGP